MEGKFAEKFGSEKENRNEKELLKKRLPNLYLTLLELHKHEYKYFYQENIKKKTLSSREKNFMMEKVREFGEEGRSSIAFQFFKVIMSSSEECNFSDDRLSSKKLCFLIHFGRYKDNSTILETLRQVGRQSEFFLTKLKDDLYRLEFQN